MGYRKNSLIKDLSILQITHNRQSRLDLCDTNLSDSVCCVQLLFLDSSSQGIEHCNQDRKKLEFCVFWRLENKSSECNFKFHELIRQTLILFGIGENSDTYFQEQYLHPRMGRGGGLWWRGVKESCKEEVCSIQYALRARSHWVRIALISIKGFSRCPRITVTLRFRAWRVWIELGLCVCNVPKRRPPSSYKTCESVANFARLSSLGRVAQHRGRSSRIVSQKLRQLVAPPQTLSLSSGEWVPLKTHLGRERISGVATSTCCWQRSIWPN